MVKLKDLPAGDILQEQAIMPHSDTTVAKQAVVSQGKLTKKVHGESKTSYAIMHYPFIVEDLEIPSSSDEGFPTELCTYFESLIEKDSNEAQLIGTLTHLANYAWEWCCKARQTQDWLKDLIDTERWNNSAIAESLAKMGIQIEVVDGQAGQITNRGLSYEARVKLNTDILRDVCAVLMYSFGIKIIDTKREMCKSGEFHPKRWNDKRTTYQKALNVTKVSNKQLEAGSDFIKKSMATSKMFK